MKSDLIILIAHYNNPKGLEDSIMSIKEPFNVDLIIVDDESTIKFDENYIKSVYSQGMSDTRYLHNIHAYNYRMTNISAAVGCGQLSKIKKILSS